MPNVKMPIGQKRISKMPIGEMTISKMPVSQMLIGQYMLTKGQSAKWL